MEMKGFIWRNEKKHSTPTTGHRAGIWSNNGHVGILAIRKYIFVLFTSYKKLFINVIIIVTYIFDREYCDSD